MTIRRVAVIVFGLSLVIWVAFVVLLEGVAPGVFSPTGGSRLRSLRATALAGIMLATIVLISQTVSRFIYFQF